MRRSFGNKRPIPSNTEIFLIFCNRMDVEKSRRSLFLARQFGPRFCFMGTVQKKFVDGTFFFRQTTECMRSGHFLQNY